MKATLNIGKGGTKHNDRNFNVKNAKHIHEELSKNNIYVFLQPGYTNKTFEEMELDFYNKHYGEALKMQNEQYKKLGQKDRIKDMEYWLKNDKNKKPDEIILQIGKKEEHYGIDVLKECVRDFLNSVHKKYGSNIQMLDCAFHVDEQTPHAQFRYVFDYEENGIRKIGTNKALQQLGIERPNLNEKSSRYNNRKQTFTEDLRKMWYEIIKSKGIELDEEVRNPSQKHLDTLTYKNNKEEQRQQRLGINPNGYKYKEVIDDVLEILQTDINKQIFTEKDKIKYQCAKAISNGIKSACIDKGLEYKEPLGQHTKKIENIHDETR